MYRDMCVILKDIGLDYNTVDACHNYHIIYYRQHASKSECPKCGISKYITDHITNEVPHNFLHHIR